MKKGFTLIELLAVIVILAIIALIATPVILGIINDAKENSNKRSAELIVDRLQKEIANRNMEEEFNPELCVIKNNKIFCDDEEIDGKIAYYSIIAGGVSYSKGTTKESCFISTTPGEINGYNTNDPECGPDVIIPSNLELPLGEIRYIYSLEKCQTLVGDNPSFNCDENDGQDVTTNINNGINTEYWQLSGIFILLTNKEYNVNGTTKYKVNKIGRYAFANSNLNSVILSDDITDVGEAAFVINSISHVRISKSMDTLKDSIFSGNMLTNLRIPKNIKKIEASSFESNPFKQIIIETPKSEITIEDEAYTWDLSKTCENVSTVNDSIFS